MIELLCDGQIMQLVCELAFCWFSLIKRGGDLWQNSLNRLLSVVQKYGNDRIRGHDMEKI